MGKFSYMGVEISAHQKKSENGKLSSKLLPDSQNNIFILIPSKYHNFTPFGGEFSTNFFQALVQNMLQALVQALEQGVRPFF